ncbi:hypothetical protein AAF712_002324 [Marasmius tenuissimus]|uniref:Uncharacterized protein n=1 Tax=Marasmius tenuissimus TaxID=585030 RepID=A0ABR3AAU4_9AGAR
MSTANGPARKRIKLTSESGSAHAVAIHRDASKSANVEKGDLGDKIVEAASEKSGKKRRKLVAPRPFPTVAKGASATGPKSAHHEGANFICLTRKTSLGAYMRRCKDIILKKGYKTLHLSAMGAAIPLLLRLTYALPPILPFASEEIQTEVTTSTTQVQDEITPDDEDEDMEYETRSKSTLLVIIKIGGGNEPNPDPNGAGPSKKRKHPGDAGSGRKGKSKDTSAPSDSTIVLGEPEQVDVEMV